MTETHCNVWDWDRLRMVKVKGTAKLFPPDEDVEVPILAQFADYLSAEVRAVIVDDDGLLTRISTDPEEDDTPFVAYLPISVAESLADCRTIQYSKLQELDRLGPGVDFSLYEDEFGIPHKVAFKFNPLNKPLRLQMAWNELNLLKSLPPHPNIVPFGRVVLEDVESRVIGFTTKYIPGRTLDNTNIPFRFEWMRQLTQLVDFLNLELGIMHQDIAPRNLLIDPDTNKILLFDFNWAAYGKKRLLDGRDNVTGVVFTLYEPITNDTLFANIPHWNRTIDMVQSISEWTCNRELDSDVSKFRNFLNDWVAMRKSDGNLERYLNAPNRLTWPDLPTAPDYNVPFNLGKTLDEEPIWRTGLRLRRTAMELGQYCFRWERPPQNAKQGQKWHSQTDV
ncbi:STYKc [Aspergillus sclerotialis]|uniref:EKC/KEOPS complex subunit BUD32 n=1 Tax=Aspergillus sclerotialis TaxID=2070753 RepID=A0A3A2ZRG3_9EURO|nr:STYKc [Aspergillus sclerotialis]